jgi:hypothetical protein
MVDIFISNKFDEKRLKDLDEKFDENEVCFSFGKWIKSF